MNNTTKLGNFISEYSVRNRAGDDIPVYSVTNKEGFCRDYFSKDVASQDRSTYKIVPRGCFAYNPSRINVGSVDWQRKEDRVIVSPLYVVFSVSKGLEQQYLYYYLKSEKCLYYIKELASGSVRDNLKLSMLKEFTIPNITLEEQRKAVTVLEQTDRLITLQERQMTVLDELIKSRFVEMFGDPSINSMGWPMKPFAETCTLLTGNTPPRAVKEYYGSYIEWIKSDNITTSSLYLTKAAEYLSKEGANVGRVVHTGAILMTCIAGSLNTVGNVAIVDRDVAFNQQINAFIPQQYETVFLYVLLQLLKPRLHEAASSALKCILNKGNLESYAAIVPDMELQRQFSTFVSEVDKSKLAVKQSLEKLETLKKSLMQQYFG